jgi:hypothetical protein
VRRALILVIALAALRADPAVRALGFVAGQGRTRFSLRLRPERPNAVRRLVITATDREGVGDQRVTVPVTR